MIIDFGKTPQDLMISYEISVNAAILWRIWRSYIRQCCTSKYLSGWLIGGREGGREREREGGRREGGGGG